MTWGKLLRRANKYAQARAQATMDAHADPKIQLEQAIAGLQEHHRDLEAAAAQVIAQEKMAKMRLLELTQLGARYTKSAMAAKQQGNLDVARTFATKIASIRDQVQALSAQIPQLEQAASDARDAVQESSDQLQQKMTERGAIAAQIDQARMQQQMAASLKQVSDLTRSSDVPSFEEIKQKVAAQYATAQASTELSNLSPEVLEMHARHAELTTEADAILAQLDAGDPAFPALMPPSAGNRRLAPPAPTP